MVAIAMVLAFLSADDKAASEALSKFATAFKAKEVDARVAAVTELAQTQHEKVYNKLGSLLLTDARDVRIAAARGLGGATEEKKKVTAYLNNGFLANASDVAVEVAIIDALDKLQAGLGRATLENLMKGNDIPAAKVAVETAGEQRKKEWVRPIIALYKALEQKAKEYQSAGPRAKGFVGRGTPGDPGPTVDPEAPKRLKELGPWCEKVLESLTKMKFATPKEWDDWWQKNESDFKIPEK